MNKNKENISRLLLTFQAVFFILTIIVFFSIQKNSCTKDKYDVVTISSPVSVRLQDGTSSGLRVERDKVIIDSPAGLLVGKDTRFMGEIIIGEDAGQDALIDTENKSLVFRNGVLVEVIPKDKEE